MKSLIEMFPTLRTLLLAWCLATFTAGSASAQPTGQLAGAVRDTTGELLPGATVTLAGPALSAPRTILTNHRGRYDLENLPPGRYTIGASLAGFESR